MVLYGLKTCDTCRKALKSLPQAEFVSVRDDGVPSAVLAKAFSLFGDALMNTRSTTWRGLSETERGKPPLDLIRDHPALMKRPLVVDGERIFLGWTADVRSDLGVV